MFGCYGTDRLEVARFEDPQHGRFLDLVWDRVCIIEMKRPSEAGRLAEHRTQAFHYWRNSADPGWPAAVGRDPAKQEKLLVALNLEMSGALT